MHSGASQLVVCKTDVLQHRRLVEELGGCGGLTQERRLVEEQRRVEGELIPRWKNRDPAAAGLVLDPVLGNSLRILKLIVIIEKPSLIIKMTQKCVLYLGKTKLKSDNLNEKLRTRFLPQG